ncbi:MAG TPA: acyl-CoA synthetase [Thermodesulfobacteriota bacterium]|nr:acyl-CoA synthetase [Thermodesulfobacteriota bacterium]
MRLIENLARYEERTAIVDADGEYTYGRLLSASTAVASRLLEAGGADDLGEKRVAFIVSPGFDYPAILLGIWRAGGIAVPLCVSHPDPELEYVIKDSGAGFVIAGKEFAGRLERISAALGADFLLSGDVIKSNAGPLPVLDESRRAMIIYTSGTTSRPKGVVTTHANIRHQITSLVGAWGWTKDDSILNPLPLHHLHGILNVLLCALWSGAKCELLAKFDAAAVWEKFTRNGYTVFMAVPTIYTRLIRARDEAPPGERKEMSEAARRMRLMVSGSAALPVGTLHKWEEITGHVLLERYGMTEIGMALSNPLAGKRMPGKVGAPLPGVEVALIDEEGGILSGPAEGEIIVRGPNVFLEYWQRPGETSGSFIQDGWFRTGDAAERDREGIYRILGRKSVDIIKSGGYKISALEIEEVLRKHPSIADCAVVGVPDEEWGERVSAALVPSGGDEPAGDTLREWCRERLAPYKVPTRFLTVKELPRNQMGKVVKPDVCALFTGEMKTRAESGGAKQ